MTGYYQVLFLFIVIAWIQPFFFHFFAINWSTRKWTRKRHKKRKRRCVIQAICKFAGGFAVHASQECDARHVYVWRPVVDSHDNPSAVIFIKKLLKEQKEREKKRKTNGLTEIISISLVRRKNRMVLMFAPAAIAAKRYCWWRASIQRAFRGLVNAVRGFQPFLRLFVIIYSGESYAILIRTWNFINADKEPLCRCFLHLFM